MRTISGVVARISRGRFDVPIPRVTYSVCVAARTPAREPEPIRDAGRQELAAVGVAGQDQVRVPRRRAVGLVDQVDGEVVRRLQHRRVRAPGPRIIDADEPDGAAADLEIDCLVPEHVHAVRLERSGDTVRVGRIGRPVVQRADVVGSGRDA